MSLWYESLGLSLYDCGDNLEERATCILDHLSMSVPRSWWEHALKTNKVDHSHASVLHDLRVELWKGINLEEPITTGLLVALAFTEQDRNRHTTIDGYLAKAGKVLEERQELARLGGLIDEKNLQAK